MSLNNQIRKDIIRKFGTPLYLLDMDAFTSNYKELETAFRNEYDSFKIAYSFKTNYTPVICQQVCRMGGLAEVVSEMEYHMAKKYGFSPDNIIVNGPGKMGGLPEMLQDGALVMLDNEEELELAIRTSENMEQPGNIGFRLNFEIGSGKDSRFGFDVLSPHTKYLVQKARICGQLRIRGIHFHLSGARSLEAWEIRAKKMMEFADELLYPEERSIIDLGSGMFGHLDPSLATQFCMPIPSFSEYAEVVAGEFRKRYEEKSEKPTLVVEPGTTIVANTVEYITKVIALKKIRERNIVIVDGSVQQLGEIGKKKNLPISIISNSECDERISNTEITGYTCLEDDILYRQYMGPIGKEDVVILGNAGAYSNVLKPPFIQPGCKIVCYREEVGALLCKREETLADILASYL